jgi:capsular exopolysaccharide synthesis family protein
MVAPVARPNGDKTSVGGPLPSAAAGAGSVGVGGAGTGAGAGGAAAEPTLADHLAVVARRKWFLLVVVVLALVAATGASMAQTTLYRAESELLLRPTASEQLLADERGQVRSATDAQRALNNELRLVDSSPVREAVAAAYDGPLDVHDDVGIYAPSADATDVIEIAVTAHDPAAATALADLYADTFIEVRRQQHVDDLLATGDEIETKLGQLRSEMAVVSTPLTELDARAAAATTPAAEATIAAQRATVADRLAPRLESLQRRESFYAAQLDQVQVSAELSRSGGVQLLSSAELPDSPVSPNIPRNVVVGGLVGLLAGLALVFALDRLDDSVASKEECERVTGLPTLGLIPRARSGGAKDGDSDLVTLTAPTSAAAEAYRSLRTSVRFLGVDQPVRTILVTSPSASEGKTTLAVNLGVVLAQAGERVLLVSADLRRPRLHDVFAIHPQPGLTTVLMGEMSRHAAVCPIDEVPGLEVMPPGASPPNPSELLDGDRAHDLLAELAAGYDAVIIDSPPLLPVTDAQVLASRADVTLLVVAHGETSRRGLARSLELLHQVGAPVAGTVLNLVTTTRGYGTYTYDEAYGERSSSRGRFGLGRRRARKAASTARRTPAIHTTRRHAGDHLQTNGRTRS